MRAALASWRPERTRMDALERESRLWQARAAVGQDLDRLTAEAVAEQLKKL